MLNCFFHSVHCSRVFRNRRWRLPDW